MLMPKQPKWPSAQEQINNEWKSHTTECHSATSGSCLNTVRSERGPTQRPHILWSVYVKCPKCPKSVETEVGSDFLLGTGTFSVGVMNYSERR